jgi:hypothetical protein
MFQVIEQPFRSAWMGRVAFHIVHLVFGSARRGPFTGLMSPRLLDCAFAHGVTMRLPLNAGPT